MTTVAVIQARMGSKRLPGKVLADVGGRPMLALMLDRLRCAETLDDVVVATSSEPEDDPIPAVALAGGARVYRGPLNDVLGRFAGAIGASADVAVRLTADCPLIDPAIVDGVVKLLLATPAAAYASNLEPRTFPDGLDVEALRAGVLLELHESVEDEDLREHVTLGVFQDPDRWPRAAVTHDPDLGELRWTVDTQDDLDFLRSIVERLGERAERAPLDEILTAIRAAPPLTERGRRG